MDKKEIINQMVSYIFRHGDKKYNLSFTNIKTIVLMADMSCLIKYGRCISQEVFMTYDRKEAKYTLNTLLIKKAIDNILELNSKLVDENSYDWLAVVDKEEIRYMVDRFFYDDWNRFPTKIQII